jgi:hypothetical protein
MTNPRLDVLAMDGFSWTDVLDDLGIPHYTNDHDWQNKTITSFRLTCGLDREFPDEPFLVVWSDRAEPTTDEILAVFKKEFGDER